MSDQKIVRSKFAYLLEMDNFVWNIFFVSRIVFFFGNQKFLFLITLFIVLHLKIRFLVPVERVQTLKVHCKKIFGNFSENSRKYFRHKTGNSSYCLVGEISSLLGKIDIFHNLSGKRSNKSEQISVFVK